MYTRRAKALKITVWALFIVVLVASLSLHEAPLPEVLPKNITVVADDSYGVVIIGPDNSVHHYPGIADKGMVTRVIFDKRDRRFIIVKVGLWSGQRLELWSAIRNGNKPSVRAYGFLFAGGCLGPQLEVLDNRENAPERDLWRLLPPSKRLLHPRRRGQKWAVC